MSKCNANINPRNVLVNFLGMPFIEGILDIMIGVNFDPDVPMYRVNAGFREFSNLVERVTEYGGESELFTSRVVYGISFSSSGMDYLTTEQLHCRKCALSKRMNRIFDKYNVTTVVKVYPCCTDATSVEAAYTLLTQYGFDVPLESVKLQYNRSVILYSNIVKRTMQLKNYELEKEFRKSIPNSSNDFWSSKDKDFIGYYLDVEWIDVYLWIQNSSSLVTCDGCGHLAPYHSKGGNMMSAIRQYKQDWDGKFQRCNKRCSRCKRIYYCSKICQQQRWQTHKQYCNNVINLL